jgi:adenylosuccinate lyase
MDELPFMASENIMMSAVKKGGDRQELHEKIRTHSIAAGKTVKEEGLTNDLIERICADESFGLSLEEIEKVLIPENYTGRSAEQVDEFVSGVIRPVLAKENVSSAASDLKV